MAKKLIAVFTFLSVCFLVNTAARGAGPNTVTFINKSGQDAIVKLISVTKNGDKRCGLIKVMNDTQNELQGLDAGTYFILVEYRGKKGNIRFGRGDNFKIKPPPGYYSQLSITLHPVVGGKYHIGDINKAMFDSE